jgi:hypothetical protein
MLALLLLATADSGGGDSSIPWLSPAITIFTLLAGTGGFVAWRRLAHDKKMGVAQQEVAEDDALAKRWQAIIEAQTKALLEPMTLRLKDVEDKVKLLEGELEASRRKYWSAVSYIRILLTWIARHMPDNIEATSIPTPPANVTEDI